MLDVQIRASAVSSKSTFFLWSNIKHWREINPHSIKFGSCDYQSLGTRLTTFATRFNQLCSSLGRCLPSLCVFGHSSRLPSLCLGSGDQPGGHVFRRPFRPFL